LSFWCASWGGSLTTTALMTATRANADIGACHRRRTTGAADGTFLGAMTTTRKTHAHRDDGTTRMAETMLYADPRRPT
jgi:hypothetical protein